MLKDTFVHMAKDIVYESLKDTTQILRDAERGRASKCVTSDVRFGTRHVMSVWAFFGLANLYLMRVDMSITIVAMATQNFSTSVDNFTECGKSYSEEPSVHNVEFEWSNTLQGIVLSAFYYGYVATQIPAGFLARFLGGKRVFGFAVLSSSTLALMTPLVARFSVWGLVALRIVQGMLQGLVFPSIQTLLSKWSPSGERSKMVAFTFAGCQCGTVLGILIAGFLCDNPSLGWPSVFYIFGGLGILWSIGWMVFTYESPSQHPRITNQERCYIEISVERPPNKELSPPWRSFMTSPALYAIAGAHFANDWGCFAVMTCLPKFMKDILHFGMKDNGFLSSLPYLVVWIVNFIAGPFADFLRGPNRLKTVQVRKLMVSLGLMGPAALLLAAAYLPGCGKAPVVALLTGAMGFSGFTVAGHSVNHLDIAPAFAGLLFAMTNTFGSTSGFIGPALAGALTHNNDTRAQWQVFFLISGAVYASGGLIYVLFARGEVQPWAKVNAMDTESIVAPSGLRYGSIQSTSSDEDSDSGGKVIR